MGTAPVEFFIRRETMRCRYRLWKAILLVSFLPSIIQAQVTRADYERAAALRRQYDGLALNVVDRSNWIGKTDRFWYRKSVKGGYEFVVVDAEALTKKPAFDHEKLAVSLSAATGKKYTAITLPILGLTFVDNEQAIEFVADASRWRCGLTDYNCQNRGSAPTGPPFAQQANPEEEPPAEYGNDVLDGMVDLSAPVQQGTQAQSQQFPPRTQDQEPRAKTSPDGKWEAFIEN